MDGTIIYGTARFQILSSNLVRMEYSPTSCFVDEASVAVVGRSNRSDSPVEVLEQDGWLVFSTGEMTVRYKLDSGSFSESNLQIVWRDKTGDQSWKPGDKDDKNLGGVPASLDKAWNNSDMTAVTDPGPLSRNGYYFLDDSRSALFDSSKDWVKPRPDPSGQDWYFLIYGADYARALRVLSTLTGPVPMLPRYVFGTWFGSRAGYSAEQWRMIVEQFRDERFPLDVLVLDSWSTTKVTWSGYEWDYEQIPDPRSQFEWMNSRHIKVTVNEHYDDLTRDNDANFETIRKALQLPEDTKKISHDLSNKRYAELFMDVLHKSALEMGMKFWWQDGAAGSSMEGLDPYLWTRHIEYTGSERITGRRTTAFCRLGPAVGSHRYGIFFTGDLHGLWNTLPVLIPATIRGGNQLMPYMNNLCGGVFNVDLPVELYQRCVQFGSFSPILWFHGLWGLRLPWEYGNAGEETYRQFVGLRYRLLPYIYTYSRIAHETGLPLVRGLFLEYPEQESAYTCNQQYLFGRELLVAPVTQSGAGKPVQMQVFLPAGEDWYDYFTGDLYEGGQTIVHECPIDRMPVLVRAGSILPMGPKIDYSDQQPLNPITLDVYAGRQDAEFQLYEDDGTTLDYRQGAYSWTAITMKTPAESEKHILTIGPARGSFSGQIRKRNYEVCLHGLLKPERIIFAEHPLKELGPDECGAGWMWDEGRRTTTIRFPEAISTTDPIAVEIRGAGIFDDAKLVQKSMNLRKQVRQAKRMMKLKHALLLGISGIAKPPRVIRTTEEVEGKLTEIIRNPKQRRGESPDFVAFRQQVLDSLTDKPFESDRQIPYVETDTELIQGQKQIENGEFSHDEIDHISRILRGADFPAWLIPSDLQSP